MWEGKQNSLESELKDLHETVASLQNHLQQAEMQKMEAQVKCWFGEGASGVLLRVQAHLGLCSYMASFSESHGSPGS